jgi:phosphatidylserine/phosphatidylglycerophosphate/cardiolipin synthase-like enzyme/regulation of enolase protein 1 (concanavalin A-like superfamily)
MNRTYLARIALALFILFSAIPARHTEAAERLCDASFQDCRSPLITLIRNERVGIDVAFWFMEDLRYSTELIARWRAGVPVRVIMDTEANASYPGNIPALKALKDAGIPMLEKTSGGIVHWKTMIFAGQNTVQFSGANYSPDGFVPRQPYVDYIDEVIYFSDDPAIVNSFKTRYDDVWITTSGYTPYANLSGTRTRRHPVYPIDSQLTFVPYNNFAARSVDRYNRETQAIDSVMFRITDTRHTDALIAAMGRGVPFRLITDVAEYRDPSRLWNAYNIDRLYAAGARVRFEGHEGSLHQKSTLLRSQRMTIFGSSNWTSPSATSQLEHNIFTTKTLLYNFFSDQFDRKWNNETGHQETIPFVPQPPDAPQYVQPANASQGQPRTVTLKWYAGPWGQKYDIYFGTTSNPPILASNQQLGPSETSTDYVSYTVTGLQDGVTYYWKVVSKTMANATRNGAVWNFRTVGGAPPTGGEGDVVLYASHAGVRRGKWQVISDSTAAGGARMATTDAGVKLTASASPADYFELSFNADAGVPYRLWIRGKAQSNSWGNDSVFTQYNDSVTSSGAATYRIGTTSAATVTIEDCSGCGLQAWGWNDNGYGVGVLGPQIFFATSGEHRIRLQMREDGLSIDQIVLSRSAYLSSAPGATKNDGTILQESGGTDGVPPPPATLPSGWSSRDIGAVGTAGSATESNGTFTVNGAGADVWGTADAFRYAYRSMSGDGSIVARVASIDGTQAWTKVGVMIRASTSANSAMAFMIVSTGKGTAFQRRTATGIAATSTTGPAGTAPRWVRLTRAGNVITAAVSSNGTTWTTVGSDTFSMTASVLVGLAVSSHSTSSTATGTFTNVNVSTNTLTSLPAGWRSDDVGPVGIAGSASEANGVFALEGAGDDVWGTRDAFHFAHRALAGDGAITARVASLTGSEAWTKLGVMIRSSLNSGAAYAFMIVSKAKGLAFQRRTADGVMATNSPGPAATAPRWVKLTRSGNTITGSTSTDGATWTVVGSDSFAMGSNVLVGLAASSHDAERLARGTFDHVAVQGADEAS